MAVVRGDNSLYFATALDNSGLRQGSLDAVGILQNLSTKIASINPFAALAVGAVAAFGIIATEAYKLAKDFEQAMKEVQTISSATQEDYEGMASAIFDISKITPDNPEKLAKAYYQIASAGHDGADGLNVLTISAKAAVAGVTDTVTAADGITTILNAYKKESSEAESVSDALFNTVKLGKTTFAELSASISQVAPIASASNIPLNEILSTVATLTKQGVPTAQAMTQIRAAIVGLNESGKLDGSKTLQENMQALYDTFDGNQTTIKKELGTIEAVQAVLAVAGKNAQSANADLQSYNETIGATEKAFKTMANSNVNQWAILGNRIKATTSGIGNAVLEMSNGLARGLNKILETNESLVSSLVDHRKKLNDLTFEYNENNTSIERKRKILEELKKINPAIVGGLGTEKSQYVLLNNQVQAYNELLTQRIGLEKELNTIEDLKGQQDSLKNSIVDLETRAKSIVKSLTASFNNGKINSVEFGNVLNTNYETNIEKLKELRKLIGKESNKSIQTIFNVATEGFAFSAAESDLKRYKERLKNVGKEITKEQEKINEKIATSIEVDDDKKIQVLELLKAYKDIGKVSNQIGGNGFDIRIVDDAEIQNQIKLIDYLNKEIKKINAVTKDDLSKNPNALSIYLKSENADIKKAAEDRLKILSKSTPAGDDKTFEDFLKKKEEQYKSYNLALENQDKELAEKLKSLYKLKEADYVDYLRNLYKATEDSTKKTQILEALNGSSLNPREKVSAVSEIKTQPIVLDVKLDTTSVNAVKAQLEALQTAFDAQQTDTEAGKQIKETLRLKIDAKQKELEIAQNGISVETNLYQNLTRSLSDLRNKQLRDYIKYWQKKLEVAKKGSAEATEAEGNIQSATQQMDSNTAETIQQVSGALSEASSLFRKFGDEDMAQLLDQLAGVADGVGKILSGDIVGGSLAILNSALTVEVVSDTAKFEKAIKKLEKAIEQLDYVVSKSIGQDRIGSRTQAIDDLKELEKQADLAKQAELEARKQVKFLGINIAKKGKGSGTDVAKLEEFTEKAEEARRKAEELRNQLDELYTGTTQSTIVDSIISGLKEGEKSVADFADNFKDLIQDALLQAFQIKYLEKEIDKFYDAFAEAGSDSTYTAAEINALRVLYDQMIAGAQSDIDAINNVLKETGIGELGQEAQTPNQGLTGAIRREITEETGSELLGLFRGTYDLAKQHFEIHKKHFESSNNLVSLSQEIANNTANTVLELQTAIVELRKIADNTDKIYLNDIG